MTQLKGKGGWQTGGGRGATEKERGDEQEPPRWKRHDIQKRTCFDLGIPRISVRPRVDSPSSIDWFAALKSL